VLRRIVLLGAGAAALVALRRRRGADDESVWTQATQPVDLR
jgi:hypothetical protein